MKFPMRYDKRSRYVTVIFGLLLISFLTLVFYTSGGSYFPAWLTTLAVSIMLLAVLSIPRMLILTSFSIEVHCLLEVTRISYKDIVRVKVLDSSQMKWCIPFFGVFGIFGYYGYFIDLKRFRTLKIYARRWSNFVMIEDRFQNVYVVSLDNRDEFIAQIDKIKDNA